MSLVVLEESSRRCYHAIEERGAFRRFDCSRLNLDTVSRQARLQAVKDFTVNNSAYFGNLSNEQIMAI
jgi:hypothetical protein